MTEQPIANPARQDLDVPESNVRLRVVLALLRILAGFRGHSRARWWRGGFEYELTVRRRLRARRFLIDSDPEARNRQRALDELREHLGQ